MIVPTKDQPSWYYGLACRRPRLPRHLQHLRDGLASGQLTKAAEFIRGFAIILTTAPRIA
jgi:hypothetical protein